MHSRSPDPETMPVGGRLFVCRLNSIQRAVVHYSANGHGATIEDMPFDCAQDKGVNHRRSHILVSEEFLHGANPLSLGQRTRGIVVSFQ